MIKALLREYVRALLEMGPVANDDGSGMVTFTRPTADPDQIEGEFDKDQFSSLSRRVYKNAFTDKHHPPKPAELAATTADQQRRITGKEIDQEDLESELAKAEKEQEEFQEADPAEKAQYYADPKWYTKYF